MEARVIFKNTIALSVATVLARAISAVVGIFVTKYLGPASSGEYTTALAFVSIVILFSDFGLGQLIVQDGSRDHRTLSVYLGNTLVFRTVLLAVIIVVMWFLAKPLGYNYNIQLMILIFGVANALAALDNMVYNYFQARQEMYIAAVYQFLSTFLIGVGTVVVLIRGYGVIAISLVQPVVIGVITLFLYKAVVKETKLSLDWSLIGKMLRNGLPFGIAYLFYYIYFQISTFMLSLMASTSDVGTYSAAYRLISVLLFIPSIVTSVLYPILYQLGVSDRDTHKLTVEKIFKFLAAIGLPISVGMFLLADPIINLLYGHKFTGAGLALKILAWFFALEAMSYPIGDVLTTTNNQWIRTVIQGAAALGNVLLNLYLIPRYGIYGASVATIITETFILVAYLSAVRKKVYGVNVVQQLPGVGLAILAMSVVVLLLPIINPLLTAVLGAIAYFIVLDRTDKDIHRVIVYVLKQAKLIKTRAA